MAKKSLAELTADPFLRSLEGCDDAQLLTIEQTAGFLARSITSLSEWRTASKRPPGWIDDDGVRYPLGELRRYAREKLEAAAASSPASAAPAPAPPATTAAQKVRQVAGKDAVEIFGLDEEPMRGGRARKGVRQESFSSFLATGAPDDEWVFLMVPSSFSSNHARRPIDLIATLDTYIETPDDVKCEQLSLIEYSETLAAFLREEFAATRQARAGDLPPRDPDAPEREPRSRP